MGHVLHPLSLYEPCGSLPVRSCHGWGLQRPWSILLVRELSTLKMFIVVTVIYWLGADQKKKRNTQNLSFQRLTSITDHVKHLMSLQHQLPATEMNQRKHLPVKVLPQFPTFAAESLLWTPHPPWVELKLRCRRLPVTNAMMLVW